MRTTIEVKKFFPPPTTVIADIVLLMLVVSLISFVTWAGAGMFQAFDPPAIEPKIDLDPANLPYYAARSTLRMFIALFCSLLFTLSYGYIAAKSKIGGKVLVPLLDVLQSVPVLGFLSVSISAFLSIFPGHLIGLELASIFAIFTSQVWNMTFSFYYSLVSLSKELAQVADLMRLTRFERFIKLELPSGVIGLVWNGMVSFGGGWFFLAASESISVLNKNYTLPGIGSYVTKAIVEQNLTALAWAVFSISVVIFLVDQVFWKPLVAWSDRFKLDRSSLGDAPTSWVLEVLKASRILKLTRGMNSQIYYYLRRYFRIESSLHSQRRKQRSFRWRWVFVRHQVVLGVLLGISLSLVGQMTLRFIGTEVSFAEFLQCIKYGFFTFARVFTLVVLATIIWTPLGVMIGFNPRLARVIQPFVQFLASFPANFLFPVATLIFIRYGISINWGSMFLMCLGAQWYILFNVIAGAAAVPSELREMASILGLRRWVLWKNLILPAIFPTWVTGAIAASGGAWNASIVSEIVAWGDVTLVGEGLGTYISQATNVGDWPRIVLGVSLMSIFVVMGNRLIWRRLYQISEERYRLG